MKNATSYTGICKGKMIIQKLSVAPNNRQKGETLYENERIYP